MGFALQELTAHGPQDSSHFSVDENSDRLSLPPCDRQRKARPGSGEAAWARGLSWAPTSGKRPPCEVCVPVTSRQGLG